MESITKTAKKKQYDINDIRRFQRRRSRDVVNRYGTKITIFKISLSKLLDDDYFPMGGKTFREMLIPFLERLSVKDRRYLSCELLRKWCASKVATVLNDAICHDLIYNNAVFVLPYNLAYLVIARSSIKSKRSLDDILHQQKSVKAMMIMTPKGFEKGKKVNRYVRLSKRWWRILMKEIENGHTYESIDVIKEKMNQYV